MPRVSCLMVTQPGREAFEAQATADFYAQDWPDKELVVIADRFDVPSQRWVAMQRIGDTESMRYTAEDRPTLGALRNLAVECARGDYLLQWDDDDRYHPERITRQVTPLLTGNLVATCLTSQLYYFTDTRDLYWVDWYNRRPQYQAVLIPGTVCVRAKVGKSVFYPESGASASRGEDGDYLRDVSGRGKIAEPEDTDGSDLGWLYLRQFHGENTWGRGRFLSNATWLGKSRRWLSGEQAFLEALFNQHGWATPGPIAVHGSDGPAFTIEVSG